MWKKLLLGKELELKPKLKRNLKTYLYQIYFSINFGIL